MDIQHLFQTFHTWTSSQDLMMLVVPIFGMIWLIVFLKSLVIPTLRSTNKSLKDSDATIKAIEAMIDQAVKRAPPVEAKPAEEGAPFEEYRKDLWRMAEGEISIDEFVDIWRGRKVQKRPPKEKKLTPEEIKQVANSDTFKTIMTVISEFSKGLEKIVVEKKAEALSPVVDRDWEAEAYLMDAVRKDLATDPGSKFLVMWAQYLKSSDPGKLADCFTAWLKGDAGAPLQGFAAKFLIFMKHRNWDQVYTVIEPQLQAPEHFQTAYADVFFMGFRDGVVRRCKTLYSSPIRPHESSTIIDVGGLNGYGGVHGAIGISGFTEVPTKQPKYSVGWIRVKRPTSPAFGQIGVITSVTDNGIEWQYTVDVMDAQGRRNTLWLTEEDFDLALPRCGEWWCWTRTDHCESVYRPSSYDPFVWRGIDDDPSHRKCCADRCLIPVYFGRGS